MFTGQYQRNGSVHTNETFNCYFPAQALNNGVRNINVRPTMMAAKIDDHPVRAPASLLMADLVKLPVFGNA